jgi:hypothetical protein
VTLLARRDATEATKQRFMAKPFDWTSGGTCVHLVRFHLAQMGHSVPPMPRFRSPLGAARALRARGWADLPEMLDSMLPRIAPAARVTGDIVALPTEGAFGALAVAIDSLRLMGYLEGHDGLVIAQPGAEFVGAWRA